MQTGGTHTEATKIKIRNSCKNNYPHWLVGRKKSQKEIEAIIPVFIAA